MEPIFKLNKNEVLYDGLHLHIVLVSYNNMFNVYPTYQII